MGAKSALVKGGHFEGEIVDIFFDGREQIELHAQQRAQGPIHGTGCALSAAIAANLAKGQTLQDALTHAYINTQKLIHMAGRLGQGYRLLFPERTK
jgi:hydroxymethylpyrimidine/phosphomethylpyrimidine kinase